MDVKIENEWKSILKNEFSKDYFKNLVDFVKNEYRTKTIYPPASKIFAAFDYTPFSLVKVVIIGQDPYHGADQANGLSFSVNDDVRIPPSLKNIYKELSSDLNIAEKYSGNLEHWARQGVLMLNATLTVESSNAGSHQNKGWEEFTDSVIKKLSEKRENLVFILWGSYAQKKGQMINRSKHHLLESAHPSPFSAHKGFFGSKPFSKTNQYLESKNIEKIFW